VGELHGHEVTGRPAVLASRVLVDQQLALVQRLRRALAHVEDHDLPESVRRKGSQEPGGALAAPGPAAQTGC
jgi:hypothetical protein